MLPHPLTNFQIQSYYQNEPRFDKIYSRNNLLRIKDGTYVINLDEYRSIWTPWIALHVKASQDATYFHSFRVEHILKEIQKIHRQQKYYDKYL